MHSVHLYATESPKNPRKEEWWRAILASLGWLSDINCQHSFFTHNRETDTRGGIDPSKRAACLDQFEFCRYQESLPVCPNFATIPRGRAGKAGRERATGPTAVSPEAAATAPAPARYNTVQRALLHISAQHPEPAKPAIVLPLLSSAPDFTQEGRSDPQV